MTDKPLEGTVRLVAPLPDALDAAASLAFLAKIARDLGFANRPNESNQELIGRALRELAERSAT